MGITVENVSTLYSYHFASRNLSFHTESIRWCRLVIMTKPHKKKVDIGLVWAKYVNTWGQVGSIAGMVNMIMMLGVFYTTTLRPAIAVPLWLYITIVVIGGATVVTFVLKIGISGYYRFFSKQSEVAEINKRVKLIMRHLGIEEETGKEK